MNECYKCKHRDEVPGSAHSTCRHPDLTIELNSPLGKLATLLGKRGPFMSIEAPGFNIQGDPHGIRKGWFNWPYNFDPVWLRRCDKFEEI